MIARLIFILTMPIWGILMVQGWLCGAIAGIILGLALMISWLGAGLAQTVEHREALTPNWMTLVWPKGKITGGLYGKVGIRVTKIVDVTLFCTFMFISLYNIFSSNSPEFKISFPIFLGVTFLVGLIIVEGYLKTHYTRIDV